MKNRFRFCGQGLKKVPKKGDRATYHDSEVDGLGFYVSPLGNTVFRFHGTLNGVALRTTIGKYPGISIEQARECAKAMKQMLAAGKDPGKDRSWQATLYPDEDRKRQRRRHNVCPDCGVDDLPFAISGRLENASANPEQITLRQLAFAYIENHLRQHSRKRTIEDVERAVRNYFSPFIDLEVCRLRRFQIQQWHSQLGVTHGRTTANRAVQLLRAVINKGIDWELVPDTMRNPCQRITLFKLQKRDRYLGKQEIERLLEAIDNLRYETTKHFILMCLFTGQRRSNVMAMRFDEVDFDRSVWRIPRTKNGEPHIVPLIEPALRLLQARRGNEQRNGYVFSSERSSTGHLTKPELAWSVLRESAGIPDVRIHDLRRSLGSWAAIEGASLPVLAKLLGHSDYSSTAIYARLDIEPVRKAINRAATAMGITL